MSKIPDRWLDYRPYGEVIKGTKIVAFKVPLKKAITKSLPEDQQFTPEKLRQAFPRLKFIVDLTNTNRYYDEKEFTRHGIQYKKITAPGQVVPPLDKVIQFFEAMDKFTAACGRDELVGVHCTHGINRTGYLICRYLIQQLGWKFEDSLKAFEGARGYPIERKAYVASLQSVLQNSKLHRMNFARPGPHSHRPRPYASCHSPPLPAKFKPMSPPVPCGPPPCPMFRPRPFRYGPPMRPPFPPGPAFPPRMAGPARMPGPPRLAGPPPRLLPPKMPPPLLPPLPPPPPPSLLHPSPRPLPPMFPHPRFRQQKPPQVHFNRIRKRPFNLVEDDPAVIASVPKMMRDEDFTLDTFEENLISTSSRCQSRRIPPKRRQLH